ncbi:isochorismatase family protein [Roseovarius sp. PS-C2]|uniref:isochorismatase family protein n=1 Tax=Roseovarius sp. PS-C2 TaxID=2820814 RepID=UPI001C0D724E|nr:isochorismatase family protein [Roseovarius sp. PS-C2]MBU3258853.1 isochorismatase family protein [Roseovarius sp. PS-C2]
MIRQFGLDTALLLIDVQKGVHVFDHWGGPTGRMNNPACQARLVSLLRAFRAAGRVVAFTRHDSLEPDSPLKLSLETGEQLEGLETEPDDIVVRKDVNSAFLGTSLEIELRRAGIQRLVVAGYFTNFCVETSVRMAGNMGFDVYLAHDACATCNRIDLNGTDHDPDHLHDISVAVMHGEFCTALPTDRLTGLLTEPAADLNRAQGNEAGSLKPEIRIA